MRTPSRTLLGLATLSALLVGCGGSGDSHKSSDKTVSVSGGASADSKTVDTAIASSIAPATVTIGGESVVVPANTTIPAGSLAILSTPERLFNLSGTGTFTVGGNATGVSFADGKLDAKIALAPTGDGTTTLRATAPEGGFKVGSGSDSLTINSGLEIGVPVLSDGTAGIPSAIGGSVPTNGGTGASTQLNATYPAAFATGYHARLTLSFAGVTIVQTKDVAEDGTVAFSPSSSLNIPSTGVDALRLELIKD